VRPLEVRQDIDHNTAKLKQQEAKFYLGVADTSHVGGLREST
jgi:hypothetical protein